MYFVRNMVMKFIKLSLLAIKLEKGMRVRISEDFHDFLVNGSCSNIDPVSIYLINNRHGQTDQ